MIDVTDDKGACAAPLFLSDSLNLAPSFNVGFRSALTIAEGAASWLGTLAHHAPTVHERTYRSLLAARTLAAASRGIASDDIHFEDLGALYPLEATRVERIAEHIGLPVALRAALRGDVAALERFAQAARSL